MCWTPFKWSQFRWPHLKHDGRSSLPWWVYVFFLPQCVDLGHIRVAELLHSSLDLPLTTTVSTCVVVLHFSMTHSEIRGNLRVAQWSSLFFLDALFWRYMPCLQSFSVLSHRKTGDVWIFFFFNMLTSFCVAFFACKPSLLLQFWNRLLLSFLNHLRKGQLWEFSGGPVVKTPRSQCRGPGFDPWLGN